MENRYESTFCARFKSLMESRGDTYREFCEKTGISISTISRYQTGVNPPTMDALVKIANLYRVSVDWLVGLTDERCSAGKENSAVAAAYALASDRDKAIVDQILKEYLPSDRA